MRPGDGRPCLYLHHLRGRLRGRIGQAPDGGGHVLDRQKCFRVGSGFGAGVGPVAGNRQGIEGVFQVSRCIHDRGKPGQSRITLQGLAELIAQLFRPLKEPVELHPLPV
jgi:hypothetical protein